MRPGLYDGLQMAKFSVKLDDSKVLGRDVFQARFIDLVTIAAACHSVPRDTELEYGRGHPGTSSEPTVSVLVERKYIYGKFSGEGGWKPSVSQEFSCVLQASSFLTIFALSGKSRCGNAGKIFYLSSGGERERGGSC